MGRLQRGWLTLILLWYLGRLTFELAGKSPTAYDLVTAEKLRSEFGNRLSEFFYWAFTRGVYYQKKGNLKVAREIYEHLLESVQQDTKIHRSLRRYIEYNMRFST